MTRTSVRKELKINLNERPLLVDYSFMVILLIRACQLYFTALELIITGKFWKISNKIIIQDIFNLKAPKETLKNTLNAQELNHKHSIKLRCPQRRN